MTQTKQKLPKISVVELPDFDLAEMLNTDEDIAACLSIILEGDDMVSSCTRWARWPARVA